MASVYRQPGSRFWYMQYKLPNGTWRRRSSRTTNKYEAIRIANGLEGLDRNRDRALQMVEEIMQAAEPTDTYTLKEYADEWMRSRRSTWSKSTRTCYEAYSKVIYLKLGSIEIGHLGPEHVASLRDYLLGIGRSNKTTREVINLLSRICSTAIEHRLLLVNPCKSVKCPTVKQTTRQPFTLKQFQALLDATTGEWHLLILIAGLTGQRLGDVLSLAKSDFDFDAGTIRFHRQKNSDELVIPMHQNVREGVQEAAEGVLFPKMGQHTRGSVSSRFREDILPLIGIVQPYQKGNGRSVARYSFHSLRHMLSTELNRAGVSTETRMAIIGHSSVQVSRGYTHAGLADAAAAMAMIKLGK